MINSKPGMFTLTLSGNLILSEINRTTVSPHSQFAGEGSGIVDKTSGKVRKCVLSARAKGVMFDVGHGEGSFSWEIAGICAQNGFFPDVISTDLHSGNIGGLAKDLPWVMSKFLHLGK